MKAPGTGCGKITHPHSAVKPGVQEHGTRKVSDPGLATECEVGLRGSL